MFGREWQRKRKERPRLPHLLLLRRAGADGDEEQSQVRDEQRGPEHCGLHARRVQVVRRRDHRAAGCLQIA